MIQNPVIRGFNPDPSIVFVDGYYFVATSTFEWFPGVNIYKSKDLKKWVLHSRPLTKRHLNLEGVPDGGGIWAPCLAYDGEMIYLIYTVVRERGVMMHTDNYIMETKNIDCGWSESFYLNSVGFDPSLFCDDDGKKYLVSLENHYEKGKRFNGLYIEEYDSENRRLVGGRKKLYEEKHGELVEGAHIYKKDGYYYLLKAQGGTGVCHSAQMSRSKSLFGEWEDDKEILLHARDDLNYPLIKAGHADCVKNDKGEWYMVHLASRGLFALTGRETCVQRVIWKDGWLRLKDGGNKPFVDIFKGEEERRDEYYDFSKDDFLRDFQFLRDCREEMFSIGKEGLEIRGGSGLSSKFGQNFLARRIDEREVYAQCGVIFEPKSDRQMAGLVLFYDTRHWYYLYVTEKGGGNKVKLMGCDGGEAIYFDDEIEARSEIVLAVEIRGGRAKFFADGKELQSEADVSILTDEHVPLGFTGAMIGINCIDCEKRDGRAVYKYFKYEKK